MGIKMGRRKSLIVFPILFGAVIVVIFSAIATKNLQLNSTSNPSAGPSWPSEVVPIEYNSTADNTSQPALFYKPNGNAPKPLLVALHSWSGGYRQNASIPYAEWCIKNNWVFIHPNFRGSNNKPEATGSDMVIQDILSVVEYAKKNSNIDPNRIYLVGASGGGYTALMVSAKYPDIWAGVSVWASITDLSAWYFESKQLGTKYASDIVKSLGGKPGSSTEVDLAYKNRSPLTYLSTSISVPIDINAGINDGHAGSLVPISHSLLAYNALVEPEYQISEEDIQYFVKYAQVPAHLIDPSLSDISYGEKTPLFRRQSENARITIFNGEHEIIFNAALMWLAQQRK
jgi:dipeptidyl aminopeptidase/acylaminoacyl peptidase